MIGTRVVIDEFAARVVEEMDFRREAAHAVAIRANFADYPAVRIPRVVEPMVRRRALVLEYCEGRRVDRLDAWMREGRISPDRLVRGVMELYARMMLLHGVFHADPHPGNLHVGADGRIILLDFGMVVRVPLELRRELERTTTRQRVELLADEVLGELYDWPIVVPSNLVYFARTAALIEGLGTHYDPHLNALSVATPIALSLRGRIVRSIYAGSAPPPALDPAWAIGTAIGTVARIIQRTGNELFDAVRTAVQRDAPGSSP